MGTNSAQKRTYALLPGWPRTGYGRNYEEPPPVGASRSDHRKRVDRVSDQIARGGGKGRQGITPHPRCVDVNMETHLRCRMVRQTEECLTLIADSSERLTARWLIGEPQERDRHGSARGGYHEEPPGKTSQGEEDRDEHYAFSLHSSDARPSTNSDSATASR